MKMIARKPKTEPRFAAEIYRSGRIYRVIIGMECTEIVYQGPCEEIVDFSDLKNKEDVERWVDKRVSELRQQGETVEFDNNFRYKMTLVLESLYQENPGDI